MVRTKEVDQEMEKRILPAPNCAGESYNVCCEAVTSEIHDKYL